MQRLGSTLPLLALILLGCPPRKPLPSPTPEAPPERAAVGIEALTPDATEVGRAVTVVVAGWGFSEGTSVELGPSAARGVDVISPTELTFRAPEDLPAGAWPVRVRTPRGDTATAPRDFVVRASTRGAGDCTLKVIYFDYDAAAVDGALRQAVADNAACLRQLGATALRLEGHADERGSTEYNLSLGERRADAVRGYLKDLGFDTSIISTLSFGEEKPADAGSGEAAWAKNRRVEFVVR